MQPRARNPSRPLRWRNRAARDHPRIAACARTEHRSLQVRRNIMNKPGVELPSQRQPVAQRRAHRKIRAVFIAHNQAGRCRPSTPCQLRWAGERRELHASRRSRDLRSLPVRICLHSPDKSYVPCPNPADRIRSRCGRRRSKPERAGLSARAIALDSGCNQNGRQRTQRDFGPKHVVSTGSRVEVDDGARGPVAACHIRIPRHCGGIGGARCADGTQRSEVAVE